MAVDLRLGLSPDAMLDIPDASVDAIISDPPYPMIKRAYGMMTEKDWTDMMHEVVRQSRRVLKPHGSAVFVLQPNSRKVGSMRPWLWEFMAWVCHEWNMVQDVWWWNSSALPVGGTQRDIGLLRPSIKACVWVGPTDCYRDQGAVLKPVADGTLARYEDTARRVGMETRDARPSGLSVRQSSLYKALAERGGVVPFNCLPIGNNSVLGNNGHGAATPMKLCDWWVRYITQPGWTVLDPFAGTSTVGIAAIKHGCNYIGIEKMPEYVEISRKRLDETQPALCEVAHG